MQPFDIDSVTLVDLFRAIAGTVMAFTTCVVALRWVVDAIERGWGWHR